MDEKTIVMLEFPKILDRLAQYASFSASAELARALTPETLPEAIAHRQAETTEARRLLSVNADVSVGGTSDIRPLTDLAAHGGVLASADLLSIKNSLIAARTVSRTFQRMETQFAVLFSLVNQMQIPNGVIDAITRAISDRGDILDQASDKLATIRRDLKISHERLMSRLQRLVTDPSNAPILQEAIITQRDGRYVVPLRAEFKGRLRSIVHDQSSSGATLFVEPIAVVELNNRYRELQLEERDEERRILADLSRQVGLNAADMDLIIEILAELDLAFMRAKYAEDIRAVEPIFVPFRTYKDSKHPGSVIRLYQARHPLLDPEKVVPIDVDLDDQTYSLVITGPNTGGKTVTLKTVGLLVLMGQAGLHIPAQSGSELTIFESVYADIGDEQSIEQSLSTFSGHVTNLVRILAKADRYSLVVFDELGAGTDPQEGSALARSVLLYLLDRQITNLVATHYPELKAFAHSTPGVVNASVEFDLQTLRPTYHLTIGLPGRSNALAIAERLGLPEEIIQAARATIDPTDLKVENLLDEIHRQRDLARKARAGAEYAQREMESLKAQLVVRLNRIEDERRTILEKARLQAEAQTADLRLELEDLRRTLARARQPVDALKAVEKDLEVLEDQVERPIERKPDGQAKPAQLGPLRLGEKVHLRSLKMQGVISSVSESEAEVQVGALRVRARLGDIQRSGEEEPKPPPPPPPVVKKAAKEEPKSTSPFYPSPGMELDLRGQRAEDALEVLDRHIESAYLSGLPFVRIIHGKGTGRLRQVVREALRASPHIKGWEIGQESEGGDGVTIARLATD